MLKYLVGILLIVMGPGVGHALEIYRLGDEEHPWSESWETSGAMELIDTEGNVVAPVFLTPDQNLSVGLLDRGGAITPEGTGAWTDPTEMQVMIDGDSTTPFIRYIDLEHVSRIWQIMTRIDLGGRYPVNRIVFYPRPDYEDRQIAWFRLYVNDGINLNRAGVPIWELVRQETEESDVVAVTEFATRPLRYVGFRPYNPKRTWEIAEIEIYGEGYVSDAMYTSDIIDFGAVSSWGHIRWTGQKDPNAKLFIQTRSGSDSEPAVYWRRTGKGDEIVNTMENGKEITQRDYYKVLDKLVQGPITYDMENWSFWSSPYEFHLGAEGTPIISPGPRQYFQLKVDFVSTSTDGGYLDQIELEASHPPSARQIVAEIWPDLAVPSEQTTFTYALRPTIVGDDTGFDSVEIMTPVQIDAVRSIRVEDVEVDLSAYPPEISAHQFDVHFPRLGVGDSRKLIEIEFDCAVLRYGTEFIGRAYDSTTDEVHQLIASGDATIKSESNQLSVRTSLEEPLLSSSEVGPNPFTPNGDGINDEVEISYYLLKLTGETPVQVEICDLAGNRLRTLEETRTTAGRYTHDWDGRNDGGDLVSPGMYLYRIFVDADDGGAEKVGTIAVAY